MGGAVAAGAPAPRFRVKVTRIAIRVDGQTATGLLFTPYRHRAGDVRYTKLVVYCHGHNDTAATNASYLEPVVAGAGVPVLAMDNRGKPGGWNVTAGAQDTLAATRWFQARHRRVRQTLLWGWSMGGITSGLALMHAAPGTFTYWVSSFGVMDGTGAWMVYDGLGGGHEVTDDAGGCTPLQCPANYAARSPELHAAEMHVARAFFVHGAGDTTVPIEQSREMQAALIARGVPTSFYTVLLGTDRSGRISGPAGHGQGATAYVAMELVERIELGTEPLTGGPDAEHTVPEAPATPPALLAPIPTR